MDSGQDTHEVRFIGDMQRISPQPGDVFVITTDAHISQAQRHALMSAWAIAMPGHKVLVMDGGMKIGVIGQQPETPNALAKPPGAALCDRSA